LLDLKKSSKTSEDDFRKQPAKKRGGRKKIEDISEDNSGYKMKCKIK